MRVTLDRFVEVLGPAPKPERVWEEQFDRCDEALAEMAKMLPGDSAQSRICPLAALRGARSGRNPLALRLPQVTIYATRS